MTLHVHVTDNLRVAEIGHKDDPVFRKNAREDLVLPLIRRSFLLRNLEHVPQERLWVFRAG